MQEEEKREEGMRETIVVGPAPAYSFLYWVGAIVLSALLAFVPLPFFAWYKFAVINRTRAIYRMGDRAVTFHRGRLFVRDEDTIPISAIDNVKLDRSVPGKIFGWVNMFFMTRSDVYRIDHVDYDEAVRFRNIFLEYDE